MTPSRPTASPTSHALELGSGASATSPAICVSTDSAFYRFFANAVTSKGKGANLRVEVLGLGAPPSRPRT